MLPHEISLTTSKNTNLTLLVQMPHPTWDTIKYSTPRAQTGSNAWRMLGADVECSPEVSWTYTAVNFDIQK